MINRHLIFWSGYLLYYWLLIWSGLGRTEGSTGMLPATAIAFAVVVVLLPAKVAAVYISMPPLVRKIAGSEGRTGYVVLRLILGMMVGILLYRLAIHCIVYPYLYKIPLGWDQFFILSRIFSNFADLMIPLLLFGGIWIWDEQRQMRKAAKELEYEKLKMELQFLKAQIQPHFLFNTLNNIYGLSRRHDPLASEALLKLSHLLRYLLYECAVHRVPLDKEVQMLDAYIELVQLRRASPATIHRNISISEKYGKIAPGLLLPLLENAFKHAGGNTSGITARIVWNMTVDEAGRFRLILENSVQDDPDPAEGGIGLANVKRQLELEYPGRHTVETSRTDHYFKVDLGIQLEAV